mmetsp:Transcript_47575/g.94582  ORF Transcript_47575/g.94582 Transcript_47575/m.94582 type:complete len:89 (+) Transcript_47575:43-309(+)
MFAIATLQIAPTLQISVRPKKGPCDSSMQPPATFKGISGMEEPALNAFGVCLDQTAVLGLCQLASTDATCKWKLIRPSIHVSFALKVP